MTSTPAAWLLAAFGTESNWGGNDGYDDDPAHYYSWDSTVDHHVEVRPGDYVAVRDTSVLIGISVIEEIVVGSDVKDLYKCPSCGRGKISPRITKRPKYRCSSKGCKAEFHTPQVIRAEVTTYRSRHDAGWSDLQGVMTKVELRAFSFTPRSIQSIQRLQWGPLQAELGSRASNVAIQPAIDRAHRIAGGFGPPTTRVARVGQHAFRSRLAEMYGETCAFTGRTPMAALDAAHLYSYAALGEHHLDGGLLLRSDIHVLFDAGLLAVNPMTMTVDVHPSIRPYAAYGYLHGRALAVQPPPDVGTWLRAHWAQHRER